MEPLIQKTLLLLLIAAHSAFAVPLIPSAAQPWQSSSCVAQCLNAEPLFVRFDAGNTYRYRLETTTAISGHEFGQQVVGIAAVVQVSALSRCEMSLELMDARVSGVDTETALAFKEELEAQPIHFGYEDGVVTRVCPSSEDNAWTQDVKKSIVSALQMSAKSLKTKSVVFEKDIAGDCETQYEPIVNKYSTLVLQKTKLLNKCADRQHVLSGFFPRLYGQQEMALPLTNASFRCAITLDSDLVSGVTCDERQELLFSRVSLESRLNLRLEGQSQGLSATRVKSFLVTNNHLKMSSRFGSQDKWSSSGQRFASESDLIALLRSVCQHVSVDTTAAVQSFPELVSALTHAQPQVIARVAKGVQNGEMCSSGQLWDLFLDASALAASEGSVEVLVSAFENQKISKIRSNYLFSLLSFTSEPNVNAIQKLIPLLKTPRTPKHVLLGISGLIHNARHSPHVNAESVAAKAIEQLIPLLENANKDSHLVAIIKAIENIGADVSSRAQQVLMQLALDSRQKDVTRVAAIKAMTEALDRQKRQELIEKVFQRRQESNELRIIAYKAVIMSGASKDQIEQIRQQIRAEDNRDIQQYVRSHQKNLKETSDPHKKDVLPPNAPQFQNPSNQWFGISNNFESSFLVDALSVGVAIEGDVIHAKGQEVPQSVTVNFTLPVFGKELQLIEIQIQQKGLEDQLKHQIKALRRRVGHSLSDQMIKEVLDFFASAHQWTDTINSRDVELSLHVKVDGKTVLCLSLEDLKSGSDFQQMWRQWRQQLQQRLSIDRAFAVQPVNTRIRIPNANGMPVELRLNATLVSTLKAEAKVDDLSKANAVIETQIAPSFALQMEAGIEFAAKTQKKAIEMVARLSSAPIWDSKVEIRDSRMVSARINFPKDKQTLIRFESAVYERDQSGHRRIVSRSALSPMSSMFSNRQMCSQSTHKIFGLELCGRMQSPAGFEVWIEKSDRSMKGFEFTAEMPSKSDPEMQTLRLQFNTPNSQVNRELSAEVQISRPQSGRQEAKVELKSPWMRWSAQTWLNNEEKEHAVGVEIMADGKKQFSLDVGVESQTRGQKREFRPRLRLQTGPQAEVIAMQGSVSVAKGRKNQLQINLEGNQKQFLKGSFVREGERKSNDLRLSTDLSIQLPSIEVRVNGMADKSPKHMSTDLTLEYRFAGKQSRKESVKVSAKVQNLTQSQLTKMSAFGELTSTQFPNANFHLAYNLLHKPREHVENELTVQWKQQLNQKIHVLHVTKLSVPSSQDQKLENTLDIEITPLRLNYELRANADLKRGAGSEGPKYSAEVIGKDRTGNKQNDIRAHFEYVHVSRAPLHLTMEATLKTSGRDMAYRDVLRETSSGQYSGKTFFQWNKDQKADLDYNYRIKSSDNELHHEMDAEFKGFGQQHPIRHSGLLRLSRSDFELKSKINAFGNQLYDLDTLLKKDSTSRLQLETPVLITKVMANPYHLPQLMSVEMSSPKTKFEHKSNIEFLPKMYFALKSDTKRQNRNVFAIDNLVSRQKPSRLIVTSDPFEGRFDLDLFNNKKSAILDLKSNQYDWKHSSSVHLTPKVVLEVNSKTETRGKPFLSVNSILHSQPSKTSFLNIQCPQQQSALVLNADLLSADAKSADLAINGYNWEHKSQFQMNPKNVKMALKTLNKRQLIHDLDYEYNPLNGVHSAKTSFGPKYAFEAEAKTWNSRPIDDSLIAPYLQIGAKANQIEHKTKVVANPHQKTITVESKTRKGGQNVVDVNALLANDLNTESSVRLVTPAIRTVFATTPVSGAKLEHDCHHINHVTTVQWPRDNYSFDSKTQMKAKNHIYAFAGKHLPRESFLAAKSPLFESDLILSRDLQNPKLKLNFKGNDLQILPYTHVTELEATPSQRLYSLSSRTGSLVSNDNILSLTGDYRHSDASMPSTLHLKYGPEMSANLKIQAFNPKKSFQLNTKSPKYSHVTDLQMDAESLNLKSRTDNAFNSQNLLKVDAFVAPRSGQKSHFSLVTQNSNANLEYEPQRRAKIEINSIPFEHKTEVMSVETGNGFKVVSKTQKSGQNLLDLSSALNLNEDPSHLAIVSPLFQSSLWANPSQKSAKIGFKSQSFEHNSELSLNPKEVKYLLKSKTQNKADIMANIEANIDGRQQRHSFVAEIPHFAAQSALDFAQNAYSVDYRSKLPKGRHLLASVAPNDQNGFHCDIAWDVDKDPNQRLVLDVSARREGSGWAQKTVVAAVKAVYAGNQLSFASRMTAGNVVAGPHEWSLDYTPKYNPSRDSMALVVKHVIKEGKEMQCNAIYSEAHELKFSAKLNAKVDTNAPNGDHEIVVSLETTAPKNPDLELKVSFNERHTSLKRRNAEIFAEVKALRTSVGKQILSSIHVKRDSNDRKLKANLRLETPTLGQQELEFIVSLADKQLAMSAMNQNGKQLELTAKVAANAADFDLKSNVNAIPSLRANALLISGRELSITVDADALRKLDFWLKKSGEGLTDGIQAEAKLETSLWPKMEAKVRAKVNSQEIGIETNAKYDNKEFIAVQLDARRQSSGVWSGKAHAVANGAELASASLESTLSPHSLSYIFGAKSPKWSGIHATLSSQKISSNERKLFVKICAQNDVNCLDVKSDVKYGSGNIIPEKLWLSVTKMGTNLELKTSFMEQIHDSTAMQENSLLGLTIGQQIKQRVRNQFLVSINSHSIGFDSLLTSRDRHFAAFDSLLKLYFPSNRFVTLQTDFARKQSTILSKTQIVTDASAEPLIETSLRLENNREAAEIRADLQMTSNRFQRSPKTMSLVIAKPNQNRVLSAKLALDLSRDPNHALTVETIVNQRPIIAASWSNAPSMNTTASVAVFTRDRRLLDFSVVGHVSRQTVGLLARNVNRRGEEKTAFYWLKFVNQNRFEAVIRDPMNSLRMEGAYGKSEEEMSTDLKIVDEKSGSERDIRLSLVSKCLKIESKMDAKIDRKISFCFNDRNRNDKILAINAQSIDERNRDLSVDLNLEVDTRSDKSLKLQFQWSPEVLRRLANKLSQNSVYSDDSSSSWLSSEMIEELRHKSAIVSRQINDDIVLPMASLVSDETYGFLQEFWKNFAPIGGALDAYQQTLQTVISTFEIFVRKISRIYDHVIPDSLLNGYRSVVRIARRQCKRSEICYKAMYALETYGFESLLDIFSQNAISALETTHRFVFKTSGRLVKALPSPPQWIQDYVSDYAQYVSDAVDAVIASNDDLRAFVAHAQTIAREVLKDNVRLVKWSSVKESALQMADIIFSMSSSSRVMVWDPQRGRVQIELRSPVIRSRRLRAAIASASIQIQQQQESLIAEVEQVVRRMLSKYL